MSSYHHLRQWLKRRIGPSPAPVIPKPQMERSLPPEERRYGSANQCVEWCERCGRVLDS